ncbi:MAG: SWIM zinc finger family protein [Acidimicrobiales bacterium]|nr:SWIM zinc finger family protein [Acidimicrobiales bacterium]
MSRRAFGQTWWGEAWIDALEGIAGGSTGRLSRGRTYARQGRADDLTIQPGAVTGFVQGSEPDPYSVYLDIRRFRDDEWDAVFDAIAAKAAHAAALLDGELDPGVVEDAAAVEVELLPRARDLRTACSCPDDVDPCKHSAAACYLVADALDADPFVLLLLRGRRRDEVLDAVRQRRSGGRDVEPTTDGDSGGDDEAAVGFPADEAWTRELAELPSVPFVADAPGRPAAWPSDPPPHAPFDGQGLRALVADAARRAWELCAGATDTGLALDERADLARRAIDASPMQRELLAERSGVPLVELEVLATAWKMAGAAGVRANDEPRWTPPPLEMAAARDLVTDTGFAPRRVHVGGNRVTAEGRLQFRRSHDGLWYLFSKASGRWAMAAPPEPDVEDLLLRDLA